MTMTNELIPARYRVLSGSALKVIALVAMIVDHSAYALVNQYSPVLFFAFGQPVTLYATMRAIGRVAFPIFCFLLVEGFVHTHDRRSYGVRLAAFAVVSEFAWNYLRAGKLVADVGHNVFFTLLLGYLGLCALQRLEQARDLRRAARPAAALVLLCLVSWFFQSDYDIKGFGCILMLYLLRGRVLESAVLASALLGKPQFILPAFVPLCLYNGERGFVHGRALQLLFYALYPAHMVVLRLIFDAS